MAAVPAGSIDGNATGYAFPITVEREPDPPLIFLSSSLAAETLAVSFVVIVRSREEFLRWIRDPLPGAEWLQVEGLLGDQDLWAMAAQDPSGLPLDVILSDPASEFARLYRLVDVRLVRDVRVTIPVVPGLIKAVRLAASLGLPVRLLPGQPSEAALAELKEAADFYLFDPAVEAPIEFFHSLFAAMRGADADSLWSILEQDPAIFAHTDIDGRALLPSDFVETHLRNLIEQGAECSDCRWQGWCAGYFKQSDPAYGCEGVKRIFSTLEAAAEEMARDLAAEEGSAP